MMRYLLLILLWGVLFPALSQPVLTITDARKANPVAPFAYYYEDLSNKLTFEQGARFPLDSFQLINRQRAIQLGVRLGTVWLRLHVKNQTSAELFLFSSNWKYKRMDVYVLDENGQVTFTHGEVKMPFADRIAPIAQPFVSIGHRPRTVHLALSLAPQNFLSS